MIRTRTYTWPDPDPIKSIIYELSGPEIIRTVNQKKITILPPAANTVEYTLEFLGDGMATLVAIPQEWHFNTGGTMQGGLISTIADTSIMLSILTKTPPEIGYTTIDLQMRFLKPVFLETGAIRVKAQVEHVGKRTGVATCKVVSNNGTVHAIGSTTCAMIKHKQ